MNKPTIVMIAIQISRRWTVRTDSRARVRLSNPCLDLPWSYRAASSILGDNGGSLSPFTGLVLESVELNGDEKNGERFSSVLPSIGGVSMCSALRVVTIDRRENDRDEEQQHQSVIPHRHPASYRASLCKH